jgi:hypothetical protein
MWVVLRWGSWQKGWEITRVWIFKGAKPKIEDLKSQFSDFDDFRDWLEVYGPLSDFGLEFGFKTTKPWDNA